MTDLDARSFTRRGSSLVPSDIAASEFLSEIKDGQEVLVTIRRPRNVAHHRLFWALLTVVCDNSDDWNDPEELLSALKLATGHTEPRMTIDGNMYLAPRSINFAAMDQEAFKRFYNRCTYILAAKLGIDADSLMAEARTA